MKITITNIVEFGETEIIVFPNPHKTLLISQVTCSINAVLYNSIGQPIYKNLMLNKLDLSGFEQGFII